MFERLESELVNFQKPGRYIGNEQGIPDKDFTAAEVRFVMSYPDVYEIGMSNQGLKIIYDRINRLDFAACERVFSPWDDLEEYLRDNDLPLFSLESRSPLGDFDFIGFTVQYELLLSNIFTIIELAGLNVFADKRGEDDPLIICGGPAVVNPVPYSPFVDLFFIGEAEEALEAFLSRYRELKGTCDKATMLEELAKMPGIYSPLYSKGVVKRQVYKNFHEDTGPLSYLIPNIDTIQNKLVVEIMRGCPNKCRFCQAGIIYKPSREKNIDIILENISNGIKALGVNEVTLSSLSSGDYSQIIDLSHIFLDLLNDKNISFSFPSIRVETFNTDLLQRMSSVRKSGLTFAIESGSKEGQLALNKVVMIEKITQIVEYAVKNGWKVIKLYFMIGLPHREGKEINDIIAFIDEILTLDRKLKINVNIAVFVPKAHTPYQYEKQLSLDESRDIFHQLREYYRRSRVKLKIHDPYTSYIEGFMARGDQKVGLAVYDAYKKGAKFDGWKEYFNYHTYLDAFEKHGITYDDYLTEKDEHQGLPWDCIDVGVTKEFYEDEHEKSLRKELTDSCKTNCDKTCHICRDGVKKIGAKPVPLDVVMNKFDIPSITARDTTKTRFLLEFNKKGMLRFTGHIDLIKYYERLFIRSGLPIRYTQGFNPHAKMQFSGALPLGLESHCELLEFFTNGYFDPEFIYRTLTKLHHKDLAINRIRIIEHTTKIPLYESIHSFLYTIRYDKADYEQVKALSDTVSEKTYEYEKKGKVINGSYKELIAFESIDETSASFHLKRERNIPRIGMIISDIYDDIPLTIVREKMYTLKEGRVIELYDV